MRPDGIPSSEDGGEGCRIRVMQADRMSPNMKPGRSSLGLFFPHFYPEKVHVGVSVPHGRRDEKSEVRR